MSYKIALEQDCVPLAIINIKHETIPVPRNFQMLVFSSLGNTFQTNKMEVSLMTLGTFGQMLLADHPLKVSQSLAEDTHLPGLGFPGYWLPSMSYYIDFVYTPFALLTVVLFRFYRF